MSLNPLENSFNFCERDMMKSVIDLAKAGKIASEELMCAETNLKNQALLEIASDLSLHKDDILAANQIDLSRAANSLSQAMLERLSLNPVRIEALADSVLEIAALEDPVGVADWFTQRPNGLQITRKRVPLGLVGVIYESRPNVTVDTAALCLKAGNAVLLRGGKEAFETNKYLANLMRCATVRAGLPENSVVFVTDTSRESAAEMMRLSGLIDVLIPRGGRGLISTVVENARVPVIETGAGCCHAYIDAQTDHNMAIDIAINAKCSRPSVCNAIETLLVHKDIAPIILPILEKEYSTKGVELRGCPQTRAILGNKVKEASTDDWYAEYSSLILAIRVVDSLDQAIKHINKYGTHHSDSIITTNYFSARTFTSRVNSACVYVNASTRFTDGGEFGLGAEIGISTQKLHARGPMGLIQLTSVKYEIQGTGQIRE